MFYILKDKVPIQVGFIEHASWMQIDENRIIEHTKVGEILISTIFLGINHPFYRDGPPVLFETMIFGGKEGQYQQRYITWDEAVKGHKEACELVLKSFIEPDELLKVVIDSIN
jgi:hypothetical protein